MIQKFNAKDLLRQAKELKQAALPLETAPVLAEDSLITQKIPVVQEPQIILALQVEPEKTEVISSLTEPKDPLDVVNTLNDIMTQTEELQKENLRLNEEAERSNSKLQCVYEEIIQKIDDKKVLETKTGELETRMEELGVANEVLRLDNDDLQEKLQLAEQKSETSKDFMESAYNVINKKNKRITQLIASTLTALVLGTGLGYFIRGAEKAKFVEVVTAPVEPAQDTVIIEEPSSPVVDKPSSTVPVRDPNAQPAYHKLSLQEIVIENNNYFTPGKEYNISVRIFNEGVKESDFAVSLEAPEIGVYSFEAIQGIEAGQELLEDIIFQIPSGTPSGTYELLVRVAYSNGVETEELTKDFKVVSTIHDLIREKYGKK